jgi:hypothetical protein
VVIRFLTLKGLCAFAIAAELASVYETEALSLYTVKKWRKYFAEGRISLDDDTKCGISLPNNLAEAISSRLQERPYLSCKVLCQQFRIAKGICLRILHERLGIKNFLLRWVSHALDTNQKAERVTLSHGILSVLQSVRSTGFQSVIIGGESRFFLYYPHDST